MGLIEKISNLKDGVHPILVKDCWQVVKINYSQDFDAENSNVLYGNESGGFAISLLNGRALLVSESLEKHLPSLISCSMVYGTSYYIPQGASYTIVMDKDCELFTVASPNEFPLKDKTRALTSKEIDSIKVNADKEFRS